jgi:hypothetical protein
MATVTHPIDFKSAEFLTSAVPELVLITNTGTNPIPIMGYAFDASTRENMYFQFVIPNYGTGNISVVIDWMSRTAQTTGAVVWGASIAAVTPGDAQSILTKSLAAETTATTTVNGTASGMVASTVAVSNLDGVAANDLVWLRIGRDAAAGGDTMTGDATVLGVYLSYSD